MRVGVFMKLLLGLCALVLSGCLLTGCDNFFIDTSNCSSITVSPASPSLTTGQVQQFTASCTTSSGGSQDVTALAHWSSSANSTVCMNGSSTGVALGPGTATVTAVANNIPGSATVTVTGTALTSVTINPPANTTIGVGQTAQFTATAGSATVTNAVSWSSGTPAVATINTTGLATGVAAGTTNISGSLCGLASTPASIPLTVQ